MARVDASRPVIRSLTKPIGHVARTPSNSGLTSFTIIPTTPWPGGRGIFSFTGSQLGNQLEIRAGGCCALVDLIAGLPTPGNGLTQITRVGSPRANIDQNIISGFAIRHIQSHPRAYVVAGVRYDFFTTVNESRGRFSAFDPNLGLGSSLAIAGWAKFTTLPKATSARACRFPGRLSPNLSQDNRQFPRRIRNLLRYDSTQ